MDTLSYLNGRLSSLSLDDFEIYRVESQDLSVEAKNGQIDSLDQAVERGVAVRLFKGGRCGFACSSDETTAFLDRMVDLAYNSLTIVEEGGRLELPSKDRGAPVGGRGAGAVLPSSPSKHQMALDLERFAKAYDSRVSRVRDASYAEETKTVTLKNSRGLECTHQKTRYTLSLMVMAEEKGNQEMAWDNDFAADFDRLDPRSLAERAAEKATSQLGGKPVNTQKSPVLLDNAVASSFLGVLSTSFYGDQVQKNRSALKGKVGQPIYSKLLHIVDDGNLDGGFSSFPFDAEGMPTRVNETVSAGILKGFLYDLAAAEKEKIIGTGNAVRPNYKEPPRVGATNFFIAKGRGGLEDLLRDMNKGFWIRDVIGVHTVDAVTGDFSLGASGLWIDGGKRSHPVRGVTISGNLHEMLKKVVGVGEDLRFYHSFGSPSVLVSELDIGGT